MSSAVNHDNQNLLARIRSSAVWAVNGVRRRIGLAPAVLTSTGDDRFTADTFRQRERFRDNYHIVAGALLATIDFQSVLDLGCANGFLLQEFLAASKSIQGVELSPEAREVLPAELQARVTISDATALGKIGSFELVTCVEVAEHVPPEASLGLLDTIAANAQKWIYFTAASPCQPGHGHVNCRQQFFWLNEFRKRGVELDWDRTEHFLAAIRGLQPAEWLEWNSLILRVI